ncbi:MAG TPA: TetR/AcrR family transcriptional regulator, partial [Rhodoglobus sp.]|nr:TetR/AcrR family transcriptional regulator [Rhodoglobus sp.]
MTAHDTMEHMPESLVALRNSPVQARSTARLTALLDAAAAVVDEIGFERLTTAMVAERAGASIGTVYRYFPDRIALLQALAARNLERVLSRLADEVVDERHADWGSALEGGFDILVDAFRTEAGFRGLRVGDVIDLRPAPTERTFNSIVSNRLLDGMVARFGVSDTAETRFHFEAA